MHTVQEPLCPEWARIGSDLGAHFALPFPFLWQYRLYLRQGCFFGCCLNCIFKAAYKVFKLGSGAEIFFFLFPLKVANLEVFQKIGSSLRVSVGW